jgi:hypothetical protein
MVVEFRQVWTWSLVEVGIVDIIVKVMGGYQGLIRRTGKSDGPENAGLVVLTIQGFL